MGDIAIGIGSDGAAREGCQSVAPTFVGRIDGRTTRTGNSRGIAVQVVNTTDGIN